MQTNNTGSSRAGGVGTSLALVLLATLLTAAATMFCFQHLQPEIERDLTARVSVALQGQSANNFSIDGQAVVLSGVVPSIAARTQAEESAAGVYGVSQVINNLIVDTNAPASTSTNAITASETQAPVEDTTSQLVIENDSATRAVPATLTIVVNDGRVAAQGILPDQPTIERVDNALSGKFGRERVKNDLSGFEGSTPPVWIDGVISMVDQLDGISDPTLKVTGSDLVIGGTVVSDEIRKAKLSIADRLLGTELNVIDNLVIQSTEETVEPVDEANESTTPAPVVVEAPPEVSTTQSVEESTSIPVADKLAPSLDLRSNNNQIVLSGTLANESDAEELRNGVGNLFGQNNFEDQLQIDDSVASAEWISDALIVAAEIRTITDFGMTINRDQMQLSGNVFDREQGRDLSITATELAGSKLGVLNNFSVGSTITESAEDLLALSLLQELDAFPTENIIFNKNSTTLTESAQEVLDDVAAAILGYNGLVVEIAGHTDSSGDAVRNLRLSKERATAVYEYLISKNVPAERLRPIGYGETSPIADNETDQGRAANRRIEFKL